MFRLVTISCVIIGVLTKPPHELCKISDSACMLKLANNMFKTFFSLSNELDPLHMDVIEGNLPTMKYTLTDANAKGFKDCEIEEIKLDLAEGTLDNHFICPRLELDGKYVVTGTLRDVPIEGNGNYSLSASNYAIHTQMKIELESKDGKTHIHVKSITVDVDPRERVVTKIDNLFNGDKKKAEETLKIFNENWKDTTKYLHTPIMSAYLDNFVKVANVFFSENAVENYLSL